MDILNVLDDINSVVVESMIEVCCAKNNYDGKTCFINDYNNDVEIPSIYAEMFNDEYLNESSIIMEAEGVSKTQTPSVDERRTFRYDFLAHTPKGAKNNRAIAELLTAAFLASQEAKKAVGKSYNKLRGVNVKRTPRMQKIIDKLYIGKTEAILELNRILDVYQNNRSCFITREIIPFNASVDRATGNVSKEIMEVRFKIKLPKLVLTPQRFDVLKYFDKIRVLQKQQREIINTNGSKDPKVAEIAQQLSELYNNAPYQDLYNIKDNNKMKDLRNETCYTNKLENKVLVDYVIGEHCLKRKDQSQDIKDSLDALSKQAGDDFDPTALDTTNNTEQITALVKQFGIVE